MSGPTSTPGSRGSPIGQPGEDGLQPPGQVRRDRLVDDQPPQRRAALAAGAGGGEGDRAHRQLQVGRRGDDHGVVAAEFQQRPAQPSGHSLSHRPAHRARPGRRDQRQLLGVGHRLADVGAADDQAGHAVGHVRHLVEHFLDDGVRGQGRQRRLGRRLPDDRVAADQADHGVPRPDGDGEIERGDDADRPERMPLLHQAMAGPLAGDRQAVELPAQADGEVADVDHLLDFAGRLGHDLARLAADDGGQILLAGPQPFADPADELAAHRRRHDPPREERVPGGGQRPPQVAGRGGRELGEGGCRRWASGRSRARRRRKTSGGRCGRRRVAGSAWRSPVTGGVSLPTA